MYNTFFTADQHFGHRAMLGNGRDFSSVEDMDEDMIKRWNAVVGANDHVYHLGDFSFRRPDHTLTILCRLNGIKYFVKGNHDRRIKPVVADQWHWVKDYYELKIDQQLMVLCHYPFETWRKAHYGQWHLHGHSHGNLKTKRGGRLDVGVDCSWKSHEKYTPWHYEEIQEYMATHVYKPIDHHGERKR